MFIFVFINIDVLLRNDVLVFKNMLIGDGNVDKMFDWENFGGDDVCFVIFWCIVLYFFVGGGEIFWIIY